MHSQTATAIDRLRLSVHLSGYSKAVMLCYSSYYRLLGQVNQKFVETWVNFLAGQPRMSGFSTAKPSVATELERVSQFRGCVSPLRMLMLPQLMTTYTTEAKKVRDQLQPVLAESNALCRPR